MQYVKKCLHMHFLCTKKTDLIFYVLASRDKIDTIFNV